MNISVESKVLVILADLARNATLLQIFDHAGNDISENENAH